MDRILVTGGYGFIGSAVCRYLVGAGYNVINLDCLSYAGSAASVAAITASSQYKYENANITDARAVRDILEKHQPSAVIHLAAETHVDRSITAPGIFIQTNIVGTFVLLDESLRYWSTLKNSEAKEFRFLHVSTDEVYGSLESTGLFSERTPYDPRSPYSASKAAADHLASAWWHTYGLPVLISNCSNNYGPYHFPEKLIPLTIINAFEQKPIMIYGDGSNVRDWLYVEDHAAALLAILMGGRPGEKYNVGGGNERTNVEVARSICDRVDEISNNKPGQSWKLIKFCDDRPGHDKRYAIDASKLESELGWRASVGFEDGLARTVSWYKSNDDWWKPRRKTYGGQRLGIFSSIGS